MLAFSQMKVFYYTLVQHTPYLLLRIWAFDSHWPTNALQSLHKILGNPSVSISVHQNPVIQVYSARQAITTHLLCPLCFAWVVVILKGDAQA